MVPVIIGTLLALIALGYVLMPLFDEELAAKDITAAMNAELLLSERADDVTKYGAEVEALREIEFDRATGKLSDDDYVHLKAAYTERALAAMQSSNDSSVVVVCAQCSAFLTKDDLFCFNCGAKVADQEFLAE